MKIKSIKFFLLLNVLFSLIISQKETFEVIKFNGESVDYHGEDSKTYFLDFSESFPGYTHIKITSLTESTLIAYTSKEDEECKNDRDSLVMNPNGPLNIFLKGIRSPKGEFLCIQCLGHPPCQYNININQEEKCNLPLGEQYSYYVSSNAVEMEFEFEYDPSFPFRKLETIENRLNFWVKGQSNPKVTFNFETLTVSDIGFEFGKICKAEFENDEKYVIKIIAEVGDYITVGSLYIENDVAKELEVNNLELMGILSKDDEEICFPIKNDTGIDDLDLLRINGNIYTKKAYTYFKNGKENDESSRYIEDGLIQNLIYPFEADNKLFCVSHYPNSKKNDLIFSIQLTSPSLFKYNQYIYPPHLPGVIYTHYLLQGEIVIIQGMEPREKSNEINFNMKARKGFPDMYFDMCEDYPNCEYNENSKYLVNPHHSNRMTTYSFYTSDLEGKQYTTISPLQPLMIVQCVEGDEKEEKSRFCQFETSIFNNNDRLHLIEKQTFSQYLLKEENDLYTITIPPDEKIINVNLDLIIFSGDVDLAIEKKKVVEKYFLSNKIYYSIPVIEEDSRIDFNVKALKNSFYLIVFQYVYDEESKNQNYIESGVNFIQTILYEGNSKSYKYFKFQNMRFAIATPFLASFFSQNCNFDITRNISDNGIEKEDDVPVYDSYSQIVIDIDDPNLFTDKHSFKVHITETDKLKKNCLLYITGLELTNTNVGTEKSISVSDGVTQYFIFTSKYPMIKYSFHVSDLNYAVVINFNLIDKASYNVQVTFGYSYYNTFDIFRNDQIFLYPKTLDALCVEKDEVCTININIELVDKDDNNPRKLETTFYQVNGSPIYLEKNAVKQDILFGNEKKYYYFDIENEVGDITVDYKRGSGNIYAKIVKKNKKDTNPDWRGMYEFLKDKSNLKYETYLKKIEVYYDDTKDCQDGCYMLLTVENTVQIENPKKDIKKALTPFRISITPRIIKSEYYFKEDLAPKVKIKVDDFVIGNLFSSDKIYEYFEVTLPYDSDIVYIDWQADKSSLIAKVGKDRPKTKNKGYDFKYERKGYDTLFKITKDEILNILPKDDENRKNKSLRNITLTLGIHNEEIDSLYTSVYAFKIFMPQTYKINNKDFRIVYIRSDQKVQCEPFSFNSKFICAFAVIFDEGDNGNNLVVYPRTLENVELSFEGALVDGFEKEKNNHLFFENINKEYYSDSGKKFIYIDNIERNKSLIFIATVDQKATIEVLSSTYKFSNNQVIVPNPSSAQIFALGDKTIEFNFDTDQDLLVNIVSLSGEGEFYWNTNEEENFKYYLNGYEDRLTLTTNTTRQSETKLKVTSNTFVGKTPYKAGFVFYMTFYPRNDEYNIDQIRVGRSTEFNYREAKFPLNFFSPISNEAITISFTFYNYYMDSNERLIYDKELYNIWGKIISEEEAYKARFEESFRPIKIGHYISGSVDGPFATISLTEEDFKLFNYSDIENPTLFLAVDRNEEVEKDLQQLGVEVSVSKENSFEKVDYFVSENVYYNDKLSNKKDSTKTIYKLRIDRNRPYFRLEFASNYDNIKPTLYEDQNTTKKITNIFFKFEYGKEIYSTKISNFDDLYIYLVVDSGTKIPISKLTNYIFRYRNAEEAEQYASFKPENDDLQLDNDNTDGYKYTISFSPIEHYDVSYYIKAVYSNSLIEEEKKDTIAMSESQGFYIQLDNPKPGINGRIKVDFDDIEQEVGYFKVLAKVNSDSNKEFLSYHSLIIQDRFEREIINPSEKTIYLNYKSESKSYKGKAENANKVQRYRLFFNNVIDIPEYIKFEISSNDNINKVISLTPTDNLGKTDRIQLAQLGIEDNVKTWIKKEQLEKNKEYVYFTVECQIKDEEKCNYLIDITGQANIEFDSPNFNYNFYVNKKNQDMTFKVFNYNSNNKNQILTVYATGGKLMTMKLEFDNTDSFEGENILIGQGLTTRIKSFNFYILKIHAEEGDYISLGSKITNDGNKDGDLNSNFLKPNGYQLTGFLKSHVLDEECYKIISDKIDNNYASFIVGLFYNKEAKIYFKDKNLEEIDEDSITTTKGYYTYNYNPQNNIKKYICITFPEEDMDTLAYTLQFIQPSKHYGISNLFSPQSNGNIYPRILQKGSYAFFNGINLNSLSDEIIYNMIAEEGLPTMYMYKCDNYPLCEFNENNTGMIKINEINLMSTWHSREKTSPIDAYQYVMFVKCENLKDNDQNDICQFYTSIYGNLDKIFLIEGKTFSQYILQEQSAHYFIDFSQEIHVEEVNLDILITNGDISLELIDGFGKRIFYDKYILSNKIFYRIHLNKNPNLERIEVNIQAKMNSYYIIEYKLIRTSIDVSKDDINTGINYLIPIQKNRGSGKTILIHRSKLLEEELYYTSFYSLNCKIEIFKENTEEEDEDKEKFSKIQSYGYYGEDIIKISEKEMEESIYSYKVKIIEDDKSSYNGDMCMLYVSSIELMKEKNYNLQKEILITEGIPQRIHFMNSDYIVKYIYPHINRDKDLTIYFRVINSANFTYSIIYNNVKNETNYLAQSKLIYVDNNKINEKCTDDNLCYIIVSIGLTEELNNDGNTPIIEITIREIGNIPYYLPIGVAKRDFLSGRNKLNLFSTLGKEDQGFITIDFARGSGLIYAKIVEIDGNGDENPEWRQYELPKVKDTNVLKYDYYNKKLLFTTDNTKKCINGCYLLISIESSTIGSLNENFRSFELTTTINLIPQGNLTENGPIIQIQPEQYIVGSLTDEKKMKKKDMYEFYQLNIPFNAQTVEIDWQSDSNILLLNIGEERPLFNKNFKKLESRNDTVFVITSEDIRKKLGSKDITNEILTLGVYSEIMESADGNPYSFRVRFSKSLNIYKVSSDQKTLCKPEYLENSNEYRCLFMVIYEEFDFLYDTMIYSKSQSLSASIYMYGEFIDNSIYDNFNEAKLKELIPKYNKAKYDTKRDKIDFIFMTLPETKKHFYVSVISDEPDVIEFISSFKTFDNQLSPNPSSVQLFAVNNDPSINLKFKTTKPLLINIVSLYGSLKLRFEDESKVEYSLRGRDDRISLIIPNDGKEENLAIENINYKENDYSPRTNITEIPKMAFYLDYFLRSDKLNLDEINLGKTSEIVYKKSEFPIDYYSKLDNIDKNINIFFNLHDIEYTSSTEKKMLSPEDISIAAKIVSQNNIYNLKTGAQTRSNDEMIYGRFDPALQAGYLLLSSENLKKFNRKENPTLYLSIDKKNDKSEFKKIRLELTAAEKNSEIPVTEKIYQYGNVSCNEIDSYKLKVDNETGDMRIQFASNSRNIQFSINKSPKQKTNITFENLETKEARGKLFVTFKKPTSNYIYLNVFANEEKCDPRLNNYVFKYMNSINRTNFFEYEILLDTGYIKTNYEKSNLKVRFNRINTTNIDVTYSLKICKQWEKSKEELSQTIAFTEYSPTVFQVHNPSGEGINMELDNIEVSQFSYLTVIAQIKDGPIIEYVAYDTVDKLKKEEIDNKTDPNTPADIPKDDGEDDDDDVLIAVVASIGGAILIVLVALVLIILVYNRKTKDLLQQVNKISFADGDTKDKSENLLLADNELK